MRPRAVIWCKIGGLNCSEGVRWCKNWAIKRDGEGGLAGGKIMLE